MNNTNTEAVQGDTQSYEEQLVQNNILSIKSQPPNKVDHGFTTFGKNSAPETPAAENNTPVQSTSRFQNVQFQQNTKQSIVAEQVITDDSKDVKIKQIQGNPYSENVEIFSNGILLEKQANAVFKCDDSFGEMDNVQENWGQGSEVNENSCSEEVFNKEQQTVKVFNKEMVILANENLKSGASNSVYDNSYQGESFGKDLDILKKLTSPAFGGKTTDTKSDFSFHLKGKATSNGSTSNEGSIQVPATPKLPAEESNSTLSVQRRVNSTSFDDSLRDQGSLLTGQKVEFIEGDEMRSEGDNIKDFSNSQVILEDKNGRNEVKKKSPTGGSEDQSAPDSVKFVSKPSQEQGETQSQDDSSSGDSSGESESEDSASKTVSERKQQHGQEHMKDTGPFRKVNNVDLEDVSIPHIREPKPNHVQMEMDSHEEVKQSSSDSKMQQPSKIKSGQESSADDSSSSSSGSSSSDSSSSGSSSDSESSSSSGQGQSSKVGQPQPQVLSTPEMNNVKQNTTLESIDQDKQIEEVVPDQLDDHEKPGSAKDEAQDITIEQDHGQQIESAKEIKDQEATETLAQNFTTNQISEQIVTNESQQSKSINNAVEEEKQEEIEEDLPYFDSEAQHKKGSSSQASATVFLSTINQNLDQMRKQVIQPTQLKMSPTVPEKMNTNEEIKDETDDTVLIHQSLTVVKDMGKIAMRSSSKRPQGKQQSQAQNDEANLKLVFDTYYQEEDSHIGLIASDKAEQTATNGSQDGTEDGSIIVKSSLSISQTGEMYNDNIIPQKVAAKDEKDTEQKRKPMFKLDLTKVYDYQNRKFASKAKKGNTHDGNQQTLYKQDDTQKQQIENKNQSNEMINEHNSKDKTIEEHQQDQPHSKESESSNSEEAEEESSEQEGKQMKEEAADNNNHDESVEDGKILADKMQQDFTQIMDQRSKSSLKNMIKQLKHQRLTNHDGEKKDGVIKILGDPGADIRNGVNTAVLYLRKEKFNKDDKRDFLNNL